MNSCDSYSTKSKPFSAQFQFGKISNGFTQRRSISSTQSGPFGSDAVPVVSTVNSPFQGSTPIDAGSSIRKPINLWPGMYHSPVTNALWEARSKCFEKSSNGSENGNAQSELIAKNPSESRTNISYKFSSDYILREQYRNPGNEIRMGKLLEDLDALAGTISFKPLHLFSLFSIILAISLSTTTWPHLLSLRRRPHQLLRRCRRCLPMNIPC